jgi:hypothetical protein
VTSAKQFAGGETVIWIGGADDSVPKGAVGQVLGYNERGRVRVAFPNGTWNFLPSELRKEQDKGLTPASLAYLDDVCSEVLGRLLLCASIMATPSTPSLALFRLAAAFTLPGQRGPSESLAGWGVASFDRAVARAHALQKQQHGQHSSSSSSSLAPNNTQGGGGDLQGSNFNSSNSVVNHGLCFDPFSVLEAAAALARSGAFAATAFADADPFGKLVAVPPLAPLLSSSLLHPPPSTLVDPGVVAAAASLGVGFTEAVGLGGVLECVLGRLLEAAGRGE